MLRITQTKKGRGCKQAPRAVDWGSASGSPSRPPLLDATECALAHSEALGVHWEMDRGRTPRHWETDRGGGHKRLLGRGTQPNLLVRKGLPSQPESGDGTT
eukprot:6199893-Pleurochrysis_carterae.AAC.2